MYYFSRDGSRSGPFDEATWQQMLAERQVLPTDLYWKEGMTDWRPASEVVSFAPPPMPLENTPARSSSSPQYSPYQTPAASIQPMRGGPMPETFLWQSIVVTILCCWPFGIPAIVYAASVSGKANSGDSAGAKVASDKAKFWCWMAFWFGIGPVLFLLFGGGAAAIFGQ